MLLQKVANTLTLKSKAKIKFFNKIIQWLRDKITEYKFGKNNAALRNLNKELGKMQEQFGQVFRNAKRIEQQKTTNTEGNGGVKYSIQKDTEIESKNILNGKKQYKL